MVDGVTTIALGLAASAMLGTAWIALRSLKLATQAAQRCLVALGEAEKALRKVEREQEQGRARERGQA